MVQNEKRRRRPPFFVSFAYMQMSGLSVMVPRFQSPSPKAQVITYPFCSCVSVMNLQCVALDSTLWMSEQMLLRLGNPVCAR